MGNEISKLRQDYALLSDQIKHLLKAKHDLSQLQSKAEHQLKLYRELYKTGGKINASFNLNEACAAILDFIIYKLNLERCVIFLETETAGRFTIFAMEGYYEDDERRAVMDLSFDVNTLKLQELLPPNYILFSDPEVAELPCCDLIRDRLHLDQWAAFPFAKENTTIFGLLVAGNSKKNDEYYSPIEKDSDVFVGLANIAGLSNTAINNIYSYAALHREHELLESRVRERTAELNEELAARKKTEERITRLSLLQQELLGPGNLKDKLTLITDGIVRIFDADFARVWIVKAGDTCANGCVHADPGKAGGNACQEHAPCLHLFADSGRNTDTDGLHDRIPAGSNTIGRLIEKDHERFFSNSVIHDTHFCNQDWVKSLGLVAFAGYGLFSADREPMGVLGIFSRHAISPQEESHLKGISAITSQVIQAGLAEEAIIQARREAEVATLAKGDFLARMSHEIRTPMNAVIGLTHLALRTELSPKQADYLGKIQESSQLLLGVINDILDFSKIEAGKLTLENIEFVMSDVLERIKNVATVKSEAKGLSIGFSLDPEIPARLMGDPLRLGQILVNLVDNAIKFTEKGEVAITTSLVGYGDGKATLRFSVRDTGIGIPKEQTDELFQSFSQADDTITRRYGGTGLGLAIVRQLVEMMKGTLTVESAPGHGSTFLFTVRLGEVATGQQCPDCRVKRERWRNPPQDNGKISAGKVGRVLLVEDNIINQQVAVEFLKQSGCVVDVAGNGLEGVMRVCDTPYDLVFMDVQMPEMDGLEATRIIRKKGFTDLPIVAMTAHAMARDRDQSLAAGMNDHLVKPIDPDELERMLVRWISPQRGILPGERFSPTPEGSHDILPEIAGLDTAAAVNRIGLTSAFYLKLLKEFAARNADTALRIRNECAAGRRDLAARTAHCVKGVASTIGADELARTASLLESALREGDLQETEGMLAEFCEMLGTLCGELRAFFKDDE